jgi:peptidoglycan/LPS O-acetylase OafA/YrhL
VRKVPAAEVLKPLTSLRFFAAMMLVIMHASSPSYFDFRSPQVFGQGVSFFFVLSGFILTHVYSSGPWPGFGAFIVRRIARLWPIHAFALGVLVVSLLTPLHIVALNSITFDGPGFASRWVAFALQFTMTQAWSPVLEHYFSWNLPAWSISTEFAFYLAFPLLLRGIETNWWWKLLASVAIVAVISAVQVFYMGPHVSLAYASPLFHSFEFILGMACWVLWNRYLQHAQGPLVLMTALELCAVAFLVYWLTVTFWWLRELPALTLWVAFSGASIPFAVLIVYVASGRGLLGRLLSARPLVFLGEISYSVYILHLIVLKALANFGLLAIGFPGFVALLLACAACTYVLIERPMRRALPKLLNRDLTENLSRAWRRTGTQIAIATATRSSSCKQR